MHVSIWTLLLTCTTVLVLVGIICCHERQVAAAAQSRVGQPLPTRRENTQLMGSSSSNRYRHGGRPPCLGRFRSSRWNSTKIHQPALRRELRSTLRCERFPCHWSPAGAAGQQIGTWYRCLRLGCGLAHRSRHFNSRLAQVGPFRRSYRRTGVTIEYFGRGGFSGRTVDATM